MPTLRDIAKAAGVSATTVSQVLKGSKRVSPEVSERVRATAHQLGYRPNRSARALRTGRSGSLGLIVPDLANPFFPELAQAIVREARSQGFAVSLVDALEDPHAEEEGIILLEEQRVDGAIWVPLGGFHQDRRPEAPAFRRGAALPCGQTRIAEGRLPPFLV